MSDDLWRKWNWWWLLKNKVCYKIKILNGGGGRLVVWEFCTAMNKGTFYTKICYVKMKTWSPKWSWFIRFFYFWLFFANLHLDCLELKWVNFVQNLTLFTGVQNFRTKKRSPPRRKFKPSRSQGPKGLGYFLRVNFRPMIFTRRPCQEKP